MEDKWFIYCERDWVFFHRSWTGALIFALRLDPTPEGATVAESWVSRDTSEYATEGLDADRGLLNDVIEHVLLGQPSQ